MVEPALLISQGTALQVLDLIVNDDLVLRDWSAKEWHSLSEGANSAGSIYRSSDWFRVAVLAAIRLRVDAERPCADEMSSRLAVISMDGALKGDDFRDPKVIFDWARGHLEEWTPEILDEALANPSPSNLELLRKARRAARARTTLNQAAQLVSIPGDLSIWAPKG